MPNYGGAPPCATCGQSVYFAEKVNAMSTVFHKKCLKCTDCSKTLDPATVNDHEGKPYCRGCHGRNFGIKGYGYAAGGSGLSTDGKQIIQNSNNGSSGGGGGPNGLGAGDTNRPPPRWGGGGDQCATCGKTVYHNEKVDCNNKVFHRLCLKCADCGKLMEKGHVNVHAEKIYCRGCYTKSYGTKGFVAGTSMHAS